MAHVHNVMERDKVGTKKSEGGGDARVCVSVKKGFRGEKRRGRAVESER